MRVSIAITLLLMLTWLTAPPAQALAPSWDAADATNDEVQQTFVVVPPAFSLAHQQKLCHAPSADIVGSSVARDGPHAVATVTVEDLTARPLCASPAGPLFRWAHLTFWQAHDDGIFTYAITLSETDLGFETCETHTVLLYEGPEHHKATACAPGASFNGPSAYRASIPLAGTLSFEDGFTYAYDLTAEPIRFSAFVAVLSSGVDGPFSTGAMHWQDSQGSLDFSL